MVAGGGSNTEYPMFPQYTLGERVVDGCIHLAGVAGSLIAATALMVVAVQTLPADWILPLAVYSTALVVTFFCSAAYNLVMSPRPKELLRRFDHASIFLMISGTYTPMALIGMGETWGVALFVFVWLITLIGATAKLLIPRAVESITVGLYLVQGWVAILAIGPLVSMIPTQAVVLLLVGGALYSIGVLFHLSRSLPYHNAIWHAFVLVAASLHYAAVLDTVDLL
ncbi:MAG TPA: hemolysin III family protein [Hyphomicrobiaceae bacterium]|nr:hemolysin III family protein [Hyphomicrobiaceae bacterium]